MILQLQTCVRLFPKSPAKEGPRGALESRGAFPLWGSTSASVGCGFSGPVASCICRFGTLQLRVYHHRREVLVTHTR